MNKYLDNDDYWKIEIYKDGKLIDVFEDENADVLMPIADNARRKGYEVKAEKCNRIVDFVTDFNRFIKDNINDIKRKF